MRKSLWKNKIFCILVLLCLVAVSIPNVLSLKIDSKKIFPYNTQTRMTILVDDDGEIWVDDDGDGNYSNIQAAIDDAAEGDTIYVDCGIYSSFMCNKDDINIIGRNVEYPDITTPLECWPIIDGEGIGGIMVYFSGVDNVIFENFIVCNNSIAERVYAGILLDVCTDCTIRNCKIENNYWGIRLDESDNCKIELCSIGYNKGGIYCDNTDAIEMVKNHVYKNSENGIGVQNGKDNVIMSNNIYNNAKDGVKLYNDIAFFGRHTVAQNNIYKNNELCEDILTFSSWVTNYMTIFGMEYVFFLFNYNRVSANVLYDIRYGNIPPDDPPPIDFLQFVL